MRFIFFLLALFFLGLAIVGVFLPGLPTVPFLLLAAWCAARGSDRLHQWIYAHPHLGKILIDWEKQKAISRSSKIAAVLMMAVSWVVMYLRVSEIWILLAVSILFVAVSLFLLSRPEPS